MPRIYSTKAKRAINKINAAELPVFLVEIDHPDLATPILAVADNKNLINSGKEYTAINFRLTPPNDPSDGAAKANIAVDNIGKELVQWLELSNGGRGATCKIIQVMRSVPNTVEWSVEMELRNIAMDFREVRGNLGHDDLHNSPGVSLLHDPLNSPGLF